MFLLLKVSGAAKKQSECLSFFQIKQKKKLQQTFWVHISIPNLKSTPVIDMQVTHCTVGDFHPNWLALGKKTKQKDLNLDVCRWRPGQAAYLLNSCAPGAKTEHTLIIFSSCLHPTPLEALTPAHAIYGLNGSSQLRAVSGGTDNLRAAPTYEKCRIEIR